MQVSISSRGFIPTLGRLISNNRSSNQCWGCVSRNFLSKACKGSLNLEVKSNYLKDRKVTFGGSFKREKTDALSVVDSKINFSDERMESLKILSVALYFLGKNADKALINHSPAIAVIEEELKIIKGLSSKSNIALDLSEKFKNSSELSKLSINELTVEFQDGFTRFYDIQRSRLIGTLSGHFLLPSIYMQNMMDELNAGKFILQLDQELRNEGVNPLRPTSKKFLALEAEVEMLQQLAINSSKNR